MEKLVREIFAALEILDHDVELVCEDEDTVMVHDWPLGVMKHKGVYYVFRTSSDGSFHIVAEEEFSWRAAVKVCELLAHYFAVVKMLEKCPVE